VTGFNAKNHNLLLTLISTKLNIIAAHIKRKGEIMELHYSELDNDSRLIKLIGKLDIVGTGEIETKFTGYCNGENFRLTV